MKRLAKARSYKIIRDYRDDGVSGDDTEKRKDFQRMIRDAGEKGDFEVVLCWNQDRFGRFDLIEAGKWIAPLRDADGNCFAASRRKSSSIGASRPMTANIERCIRLVVSRLRQRQIT